MTKNAGFSADSDDFWTDDAAAIAERDRVSSTGFRMPAPASVADVPRRIQSGSAVPGSFDTRTASGRRCRSCRAGVSGWAVICPSRGGVAGPVSAASAVVSLVIAAGGWLLIDWFLSS